MRIVNKKVLKDIRDLGECDVCHGQGGDAHHVISRGAGGPDHRYNLLNVCRRCHNKIHSPFTFWTKDKQFELVSYREGKEITRNMIYEIMRGEL